MPAFPDNKRIFEINKELIDQQGRTSRLIKNYGLFEKVPLIILQCEDWPDYKKYRYQPRSVAHIIARAEKYKDIISESQQELNTARERKKNADRKIKRQISKIEGVTGKKFEELPSEIRMSSFYKSDKDINGNLNIRGYAAESIKVRLCKNKIERITRMPAYRRKRNLIEHGDEDSEVQTKPFDKSLNIFCRSMNDLFLSKGRRPNYELIAMLSNIFSLSKRPQNYNTIKERFSRDKIQSSK